MPTATYSDLLTQVVSYLARSDITNANVADFVTYFEAEANRRLRSLQQETTSDVTITAGVGTLPADYLTWRKVRWNATPYVELEYVHPTLFVIDNPTLSSGIPSKFTIQGTMLSVNSPATGTANLNYFQKIAPLSGALNWLYAAHPDVYLFGTLSEAYTFTKEFDTAAVWAGRRDTIIEEIILLSNKSRGVGGIKLVGVPTP